MENKLNMIKVMEIYRSWRDDLEELLEEGYEGTLVAGEIAIHKDFVKTCGYNGVNLEDLDYLGYDDIFDLMFELEQRY